MTDAIWILRKSWSGSSSNRIIKFWIKSTSLAPEQDKALKQKLKNEEENFIDMRRPVSNQDSRINAANSNTTNLHQGLRAQETRDIEEAYSVANFLEYLAGPLTQSIQNNGSFDAGDQLQKFLNASTPYDDFRLQNEATEAKIQDLYSHRNSQYSTNKMHNALMRISANVLQTTIEMFNQITTDTSSVFDSETIKMALENAAFSVEIIRDKL